ncbi:MAG TPA: RHS repeat-associated core domain-containing protein [Verrucomicrobiae bacterium]|nr:RHS repeat-associated core domain-containing protein [Verrucomicrobiae bacterium]
MTNSSGRLTQVDSFDESGTLVVRRKLSYEGLGGRLGHDASTFGMWDAREGIESGDPELITCYTYTTLGLLDSMIYPTAYSGTTCSAPSADVARLNYHYSYGFLQNVNDLRRSGGVLPGSPSTWKLVMATTYNEAGGMNKLTYANGVVQTVTPDVMMRPLTITATKGSTTFLDTGSFAYDGVGNISSIGRTGGSSVKDAFTYDLVGRLTTADVYNKNDNSVNANGQTHERHDWTYDDFGNLTWKDQDPNSVGPAHQFFVDTPTNRILTSSGVSFRYDQRGNLNLDDSHSYLFDERNRLLAARMGQSYPVGEYAYDAGGMRVLKEDPSTGRRTFYVRDGGGNVLSEFTPSGAGFSQGFWQKDYYYALGHVIGQAEEAPPKPVEGLWSQLSATTPAVATLHWTANRESNLSGYIVYRKDPAVGSSWLNVGNVGVPSNPSWTETGSIPSGLRFYRVAAVNAAGESATSRGLRVEPGTSIPAPPTIPITQATLTSVTLRWTRSADDIDALASEPAKNFVGYNVYRNPSPPPLGTGDPLNPVPLRQPVFRDLAVDPNTVYVYTIQSVGSSGGQSAGVQSLGVGTYDRVPPAIPLNVKAAGGPQVGEITILWSPNSEQELAGYHLYRLDLVGGVLVWTLLPATIAKTATSVPVTGIAEGVTTTYALSAYDTSNNESARSESVSAVTRTATPAPPMMLTGQSLVGWWGTSGLVTYGGAGGDASGYWGFRVYKKEQSLPPDQWELIFSDPISHNPGDPSEGIPPSDHFAGTFTDQWIDSCHVTQFLVSGISMNGSQTVDSGVMKIPRALVPETPGVTATQQGQTVTVTFTPRGFVGCDSSGNGFTVTSWTLVEKQTTQAGRNEYPIAGTSYSRTAPPGAQVWAYALKADVKDVLTGETVTSFLGQDVCVTSSGIIGPDDSSCDDLDGSRSVPPPLVPPLPGGTANSGGPSRMEDGTWQWNDMKQDIVRHRFNASLKIPLVEDAAPAQAETRVAVAREVTPYMEAMRLPGSRSLVTAAAEPSIILAGEFKMETRPGSPAVGRRPEDGWWGLPEDDSRVGSSDIDAGGLNLIAMLVTGASPKTFSWQFFNWDHLGSVRVVTDVNGALVAESKFLPYGEEISLPTSATTDNTHRFTGHERDGESGRDYSFARYLSSDGRFLSPDERIVPPTMGRAVAWNRYTYTLDDPILYVDPDGRNPLLIAAGAIAAFVGGTIVVVEAYHAAKDLLSSAKNIEAQDSLYAKTVKACAEGGDCRSDIAMNAVNRGYIAREVALANGISLFKTAVGEARPPIPESNLPETEVIVTQFLDHAADVVLDLFDLFGLMARPGGDSANTAHGAASGAAKSAQGHYFHEGNASDRKVSRGGALYSKLTSDQAGYISQNQRPGRYFVQPVN